MSEPAVATTIVEQQQQQQQQCQSTSTITLTIRQKRCFRLAIGLSVFCMIAIFTEARVVLSSILSFDKPQQVKEGRSLPSSLPSSFKQQFDQEAAYLIEKAFPVAKSKNYKCDYKTSFPTSIVHTANHFSDIPPQQRRSSLSFRNSSSSLKKSYFTRIDFIFRAYRNSTTTTTTTTSTRFSGQTSTVPPSSPQVEGGDSFVVMFVGGKKRRRRKNETRNNPLQVAGNNTNNNNNNSNSSSSSSSWTVFKTAAFAKDLLDGTYQVTLYLPPWVFSSTTSSTSATNRRRYRRRGDNQQRQQQDKEEDDDDEYNCDCDYQMTLYHHNTCWEGMTPVIPFSKRFDNFVEMDFGPRQIIMEPRFDVIQDIFLEPSSFTTTTRSGRVSSSLSNNNDDEDTAVHHNNDIDDDDDDISSFQKTLPYCEASQEGSDALTTGVWVETNRPNPFSLSLDAIWMPLTCRPRSILEEDTPFLDEESIIQRCHGRFGDSMMPDILFGRPCQKYDTKQPYVPYRPSDEDVVLTKPQQYFKHHTNWLDYLWRISSASSSSSNNLPKKENATNNGNDDHTGLLLEAGLHQLFKGQTNPKASAEEVIHMLCQLALIYPGKLQLVGPPPIQQQNHNSMNILSQQVRLLNAHLRQILDNGGYRLYNICRNVPVKSFFSVSDIHKGGFDKLNTHEQGEGNVLAHEEGLKIFNWTTMTNSNDPTSSSSTSSSSSFTFHLKPRQWDMIYRFRNFTAKDQQLLYGNRSIIFSDLESFLLPRTETYTSHDKIHDKREFPPTNQSLWKTRHSEMIAILQGLRNEMK